jgi:hypothetical protein
VRSVAIAYILWVLVGPLGVHRFYCGRIGTGILWFFTGGLCGIGWLVDVFLIPDLVRQANLREPPLFGAPYPPYVAQGAWRAQPADDPRCAPCPPFGAQGRSPKSAPPAPAAGVAPAHRVIYCTQCGAAMHVPANAAGMQYACPNCRTVLEVPA